MTAAIEAHDLVKKYPPDVTALDGHEPQRRGGHDLRPARAQRCGQVDDRQDPHDAFAGRQRQARVAGFDARADPAAVRRAIGVVGQKHGADPEATGRENLVLQGEFYGISGRELRERVDASLDTFRPRGRRGPPGRRPTPAAWQRRLDVAMGLLHRPRVLFMDEPTTGLDPEARAEMWSEIEALAREERDDDPAHDALPRGGRQARLAARDRRPRAGRRARARPRDSRATCAATRSRSSWPTPARRAAAGALEASRRRRRREARRPQPAGPRSRRRRRDPGGARGARRARRPADSVTLATALARRGLPAPRRAMLSPSRERPRRWPHDGASDRPGRSRCAGCACCYASPATSASRSRSRSSGCCCSARSSKRSPRSPASTAAPTSTS